jgi:hypothetical protein
MAMDMQTQRRYLTFRALLALVVLVAVVLVLVF